MFLAPAFLFGLLAIGIPLWMHRVARATPAQHPFASLMLLEASETQRTAKRTLRYWLLLALRIALLLALAFAFAGPLVTAKIVPRPGAYARLHAIVLDTSLSMQHGNLWQRAVEAAETVLREAGSSDRVMLVAGRGRHMDVMSGPVAAGNSGALRAVLQQLKPGIERLDYGLAMSTANNWLGSPRPPVVLHMISDMQRSAAPLRFADLEPPPQTRLVLHDVRADSTDNTYIQGASLASLDTRSLEVSIRNTATRPQQREVVVAIDGKEYARRKITVPAAHAFSVAAVATVGEGGGGGVQSEVPGNSAAAWSNVLAARKVLFSGLDLSAGAHRIEVALEPRDELPQDDRFYAVVEHADPKALLIARSASSDDAAYFAAAVGSLSAPRLSVEQRTGDAINGGGSMSGYSIVVIADVGALSDAAAMQVRDYVAAGGSVLATLGRDSSGGSTPLLDDLRIAEARNGAVSIGEIETAHPVLREAGDWHRVRFFRHRSVQTAPDDKVLITYDDGSPLLIERTLGAGRMLLLTAPVDRAWNDLAIHPLFVHFIAESARYLIGPDTSAASATVGSVVMTGLTAAAGGQIFDPQGKRVFGLAQTSAADRLIPDQAGFYEIRGSQGVRWLAVNVDTRESDLTPLPAAFVQRWQALRLREPAKVAPAAGRPDTTPRSLGPPLLWLAAILLLAELLLANRYLAIRREVPG